MKAKPVNVVLADSQYLIRLGLHHLFQSHGRINVVGEAENSEELHEAVKVLQPDVVIFDYDDDEAFNIEDISISKKINPETNFLIISRDNKKDSIFQVLQSGGLSYLTKQCDEEEIMGAVIATAKGEKFLCNKVIDIILQKHMPAEEATCAPSNLTVRELEIVKLTANGLTARKIAEKLFLSTHTVYTHRKNIMRKLGVHSASELIIYAMNNGIIEATEESS